MPSPIDFARGWLGGPPGTEPFNIYGQTSGEQLFGRDFESLFHLIKYILEQGPDSEYGQDFLNKILKTGRGRRDMEEWRVTPVRAR